MDTARSSVSRSQGLEGQEAHHVPLFLGLRKAGQAMILRDARAQVDGGLFLGYAFRYIIICIVDDKVNI